MPELVINQEGFWTLPMLSLIELDDGKIDRNPPPIFDGKTMVSGQDVPFNQSISNPLQVSILDESSIFDQDFPPTNTNQLSGIPIELWKPPWKSMKRMPKASIFQGVVNVPFWVFGSHHLNKYLLEMKHPLSSGVMWNIGAFTNPCFFGRTSPPSWTSAWRSRRSPAWPWSAPTAPASRRPSRCGYAGAGGWLIRSTTKRIL